MASIGARSVFRSFSGSARRATTQIGSQSRPTPSSPFRMATNKPLSHRNFRCAAEMSFCLESMMPFHSASSAALMTSMLSISRSSCGWLPEGDYSGQFTPNMTIVMLKDGDIQSACLA